MTNRLLYVLTTIALLAFPTLSFAQAPNLGAASNFALFTAVGALTNVGSSTVVGDIGTNDGAFSGFNTATVTGNSHVADATSGSAAVGVISAYNALVATPCNTILSSPELGSQTLTTGVYCQVLPLPTTLNGILTLSGPGIFIFKLSSALTTADLSSIVLTNGATADNVYFQILGAATIGVTPSVGGLGNGSGFVGTIIAMGAIVLNNTTLEGRALSTVGAITVNESVVIRPLAPSLTPDLTAIIYARPLIVYNTTSITVVVDVVEVLNVATSGQITVRLTKDTKTSLRFDEEATSIGGRSVQNGAWKFDGVTNANYYILTTSQMVLAGDKIAFGLTGDLTPGATSGSLTLSSVIIGGSGGEIATGNNVDVDKIQYFQQ